MNISVPEEIKEEVIEKKKDKDKDEDDKITNVYNSAYDDMN